MSQSPVPRWLTPVAFGAVYLIWGSTYLAIRFGIQSIPPFVLIAARFVIAGALLVGLALLRGAPRPTLLHWLRATLAGGLMMGATAGVAWAEQRVDSGPAALIISLVPLWMVLLDWLRPPFASLRGPSARGRRPGGAVAAGLGWGFAGMALLVGPGTLAGEGRLDPLGVGVLILAALGWAAGSLVSSRAQLPAAAFGMATGMQMLTGGLVVGLAAIASGEAAHFELAQVSARSALSLGYLIVFGSMVAFSAYAWLLQVETPARAGTYAFVNPVVAVILGWLLAGEPLTLRTLLAAAVIVAGVALTITYRPRPRPAPAPAPEPVGD
ncbi:MAG: EamA family transporter [Chloroflexi bacterium]|nr:EamA family transporter [Chloroflexota bacterium]